MLANPVETGRARRESIRVPALFYRVLNTLGIDRAIAYTLIGRGWSILAGPLTMVLIARFLKPEEQGFYFTFGSVIALNVFFELGLTYVLLQFASHEKAQLEWTASGTLSGSEIALVRLAALLKLALRWYSVAAGLVLLIVLPAGLMFFARNSAPNSTIAWRTAWAWLVLASACDLFVSPLFAILEGCGKIAQIASMRIFQSVMANVGLWLTLVSHGALLAGAVYQTMNVGFGIVWLVVRYRPFFEDLLRTDISGAPFHWRVEIWPFQWRIALSWLSGYFIFQLFNPVLFATHGAVVAGQMGMSLILCNAIPTISMAWMSTKASPFGVLAARRLWGDLDKLFFKTLRQSLLVLGAGGTVMLGAVLSLHRLGHPFSNRILRPLPFALLLISAMMNHVVFSEAQYLRSHKVEPFLWLSIGIAAMTGILIYVLAKPYGVLGVSTGYMLCCATALIAGTKVFMAKRKEWHA